MYGRDWKERRKQYNYILIKSKKEQKETGQLHYKT